MNDEQKQSLLEYEDLKIEEKRIKSRLEELKEIIVPLVPEDEKINGKYGKFELKKRDNWTFSGETQNMEDALKEKKAEEIAKGVATSKPIYFVEYRQS